MAFEKPEKLTLKSEILHKILNKDSDFFRKTQFSGLYYPANPFELEIELKKQLKKNNQPAIQSRFCFLPTGKTLELAPTIARFHEQLKNLESLLLVTGIFDEFAYKKQPTIYHKGSWQTPLGPLQIDEAIGKNIIDLTKEPYFIDPKAFDVLYAFETLLPILKILKPELKIVPILLPNEMTQESLNRLTEIWSALLVKNSNLGLLATGYLASGLDLEIKNFFDNFFKQPQLNSESFFEQSMSFEKRKFTNQASLFCLLKLGELLNQPPKLSELKHQTIKGLCFLNGIIDFT